MLEIIIRVHTDEHNEKDSRFKVVIELEYLNSKIYTVPYTYNLKDLNDEEIIGSFYDREFQKTKL